MENVTIKQIREEFDFIKSTEWGVNRMEYTNYINAVKNVSENNHAFEIACEHYEEFFGIEITTSDMMDIHNDTKYERCFEYDGSLLDEINRYNRGYNITDEDIYKVKCAESMLSYLDCSEPCSDSNMGRILINLGIIDESYYDDSYVDFESDEYDEDFVKDLISKIEEYIAAYSSK